MVDEFFVWYKSVIIVDECFVLYKRVMVDECFGLVCFLFCLV